MAKAVGISLPISMKHSREICKLIKMKNLQKVKDVLENVSGLKKAVPFTRFNKNVGHKKGMSAGRYPTKAASEIKKLIEGVEANAQFKGLNVNNLVIVHAVAKLASRPFHFGRFRGRKIRRAHVEIIAEEVEPVVKKRSQTSKNNSVPKKSRGPLLEIEKEDQKKN